MKQVSNKQARINRELRKLKQELGYESERCRLCGARGTDLAHLLPRSLYPEYQTEEWNVTILCRKCHDIFDRDREFRRGSGLGKHIKHIDEQAYNRYYE